MSLLEFRCRLRYPSGFRLDAEFETDSRVTALFGPSGSGKTTILSMIAGLRQPDSGGIRVRERVLVDTSKNINLAPEARHVGYVFQQHLLFPHLSVRDNVFYGWTRRRSETNSVEPQRVLEALALEDLLERRPATLSGGQRQRVALARALLCVPDLLLLDEPLSSVDDELKHEVLTYIEQVLSQWRIPTLYVTHDADEARRMCESVVRINDGRVILATPSFTPPT
jgi:molybdate transport system ATP-binding protein